MPITLANRPNLREKYTIIIPAAGKGRRMNTYGTKSLIKLANGKNILQQQLHCIGNNFRFYEVIVVSGFEANRIKFHSPSHVKHITNEDYDNNNVAHSISLGLTLATTNKVLIIYGDLVFNTYTLKNAFDKESGIVVDTAGHMKREEVGLLSRKNFLMHMSYGLNTKWAQIVYLTGKELELFTALAKHPHNKQKFGFELINDTIAMGGLFKIYQPKRMKVTDIDSSSDINVANKLL